MEEPSRDPDARGSIDPGQPSPFYRSAWGAYLVIAIIGVLWAGYHHGDITLDIFIDVETLWTDLGMGLVAGLGLLLLWGAGRSWIEDMRRVEMEIKQLVGPLETSEALALALISGFAEELFFRGAMQASWGWGWALAIFTILHTGPGRAFRYWTVFALVAGGVFAWLTLERGNLLPAVIAHIVVNGVNLVRLGRMPVAWESGELEP